MKQGLFQDMSVQLQQLQEQNSELLRETQDIKVKEKKASD